MRPDPSTDASTMPFGTSQREPCPPRHNRRPLGRPRSLDAAKRREVCAFVAGGCGIREAARYVRCSLATIRREAERDPDFDHQLRQSEAFARLSPLRAMQQAAQTHWRAAAWLLERAFPEQFGRRNPGMFGAREARELMKEILTMVRAEFCDPFKADDVERRLRGAFEYHIRTTCDELRDSRSLRAAMQFFEDKNRVSGPLADLGLPTPEHLYRRASPPRTCQPARRRERDDRNPSK